MGLFNSNSSNPILNEKRFANAERSTIVIDNNTMTAKGTYLKFGFLFLMLMAAAVFTWNATFSGKDIKTWVYASVFIGFALALVMSFSPKTAQYISPIYAICEGVALGGLSALVQFAFKEMNQMIIVQAVLLTFCVVLVMYAIFIFRIIKVTDRLRTIIVSAIFGIMIFYVIAMILRFFNIEMPLLHDSGPFGIIFSLIVVGVAAFSLLLDFDMIEKGSQMGMPKYMEWYGAFGLMVTIVWLYIEILQLLMKLNRK
ncbi:MAG: Bax inhibitor-1/YccA family protein [Chitinophagaceae bacterium]